MFTILIFLRLLRWPAYVLKAKLLNFLVFFFKQRSILNKSYLNSEIVENCLITKVKII